jgi:kynurenine formamidase
MHSRITGTALALIAIALAIPGTASAQKGDLWKVYNRALSKARYIDLTHKLTPNQPVWTGFGPATFRPAVNRATGQPFTYAENGFEATSYTLSTDQFGTQLDPPAHWAPEQAAIDEVPASYSVRPLVVINVVRKVKRNPKYFFKVADIRAWERRHGRIPAGSVVMVRSDWSKRWTADPEKAKALAADRNFSSVGLDALKFLHRKRHILFHGHEPLDTDTTPTLEGEHWLMHHGYAQGRGRLQSRRRAGHRLPGLLRLSEVQGRPPRLRPQHRDPPALDAQAREDQEERRAASRLQQPAALGHEPRLPRPLSRHREGGAPAPPPGAVRLIVRQRSAVTATRAAAAGRPAAPPTTHGSRRAPGRR